LTRAAAPRSAGVRLQQHARLPARYAYALLAGRRVLDDLPQQWETITRAHRVRLPLTPQGRVARLRARDRIRCAFSLLVDAVRRADRVAFALETRGLGAGPRTLWRPVPLEAADALLAPGVALAVAAVLVLGLGHRPAGAPRARCLAGEAFVGLDVPPARLGDHPGRQLRRRRGGALGPAGGGGGQPVAHELLVQARRGAAGGVGVRGPAPARVRGEHLVAERQRPVHAGAAELELGVGEDDAALVGDPAGPLEHGEGQGLELLGELLAQQLPRLRDGDVLRSEEHTSELQSRF